ncbi:type II secretion system protein GspK [Xanthobacter autotrophicus DSM 431]|uniref:general secretion pathway protein GspK n=1 Tax=Xanthobacter nonsaccharivorans TaxID=3119912 RepID=UPI00372BA94F
MTAPLTPEPPARPQAQDGFILVAVLWILAALATLVGIYATYVSASAMAAVAREEDILADGLAAGAVELAAYRLIATPKEVRPTSGEIGFRRGRAQVLALFRDESARIDLNAASKDIIAGLFVALGAKPEAAADYAGRIVGWRTAPAGGSEELPEAYRDAGLDYGPRGAAYVHVDEVWRVPGLPAALLAQAMPFLTVYSGRGEVNAREASPLVLAALPGAAADAGNGAQEGTPPVPPGTTTEPGESVRVTVRVTFDSGRTRTAEAVLLLRDFGEDPYRILSWRADAAAPDLPPPPPRAEARR